MAKGRVLVVGSNATRIELRGGGTGPTGQYLNETVVPAMALIEAGYDLVLATPSGRQAAYRCGVQLAATFRRRPERLSASQGLLRRSPVDERGQYPAVRDRAGIAELSGRIRARRPSARGRPHAGRGRGRDLPPFPRSGKADSLSLPRPDRDDRGDASSAGISRGADRRRRGESRRAGPRLALCRLRDDGLLRLGGEMGRERESFMGSFTSPCPMRSGRPGRG